MAALCTDSKDRPSVVIGKDTRISSDMFEAALSCGLTASGCDVYLLGLIEGVGNVVLESVQPRPYPT